MRRTTLLACVALCSGFVSSACGSKTGLNVPDAGFTARNTSDSGTPGNPQADAEVESGDAEIEVAIPCVEVRPESESTVLPLETQAQIGKADVVFLIDTTASMMSEIDRIRGGLRDRIVPAARDALTDVRFGVATFADFPVGDYGRPGQDLPFVLRLQNTDDVASVQATMNSIGLGEGSDEPESQVEALYQLATGDGIGAFVPPSAGCATGGQGYVCFREDALPVILLFTDAPFHNGPSDDGRLAFPYSFIDPPPHTYSEAVVELNRLDARVIGFDSGRAENHLSRLAEDTQTLDEDGDPLVIELGANGEGLNDRVVRAIQTLAGAVVFDVDARYQDLDLRDGIEVSEYVQAIAPVRATPAEGVSSIDEEAGVFRQVVSGTDLVFNLVLRDDIEVPPETIRFEIEVVFLGDGRTQLDRRRVEVVVPSEDGPGCDEER
ncbi:MAG: vWA domain-containing protein [Myxococcota bacterium]